MIDRITVCIILVFHTVCLGYFHHIPFYRTGQLPLLLNKAESNLHQNFNGFENEANAILQYIHKSPRNMVTTDILRSFENASGNDTMISSTGSSNVDSSDNRVNLSKHVLLEVMTKLVERRDHVRFGDMLSVYATQKNENTDTNWDIDGSGNRSIETFFRDDRDKVRTIIDMDVLMLLVISLQRMKAKKRQSQSLELLQKVLMLAFHYEIVNTFVLSMILVETEYSDEGTQFTQYKDSIASILDSNRNDINTNKSINMDIVDKTTNNNHFKNGIIQRKNLDFVDLNFADFVSSNVFMLGIVSTPLWSRVQDIIIEYKQHPSWNKKDQDLNVIYYLSLIDAIVEEKRLGLLVLHTLNKFDKTKKISSSVSIYQGAFDLIQFIRNGNFSYNNNEDNANIDNRIADYEDFQYSCSSTDKWEEIYRFMGRNLNRLDNTDTDMDTDNTDTDMEMDNTNTNTFDTDIRLLETMSLISPSLKSVPTSRDLKNMNTFDGIKGNEDIYTPAMGDSPKAYCSFLNIVLPILSNNEMQSSMVLEDKGKVRENYAVLERKSDPIDLHTKNGSYVSTYGKTKAVLTLGDGDLSFSASLIKLIQDRDKDEGASEGSQLNTLKGTNFKNELINIDLTVSVYESSDSLISKYSNAASNIKFINAIGGRVEDRASSKGAGRGRGRVGGRGRGNQYYSYKRREQKEDITMNEILNGRLTTNRKFTTRILYNLDATVLEAADFYRSNNRRNINRTSDNIDMKNDGDVKGFDDVRTEEPSLGAEELSARPEESNMNGFDFIIFNFPFGDAIDPSSGYSTANMTPPTANLNPDDLNTGYPSGTGAEYPINGESSLKSTIPISDMNKQSIKINDKKVKSSAFDTHFVARGRHINLISGLFKSAKKILKPQNIEFEDEPKIMITLLLSQALEWEVEELALSLGFRLSGIIPFEDVIFESRGYSRKRTYVDDIFPSSSSPSKEHSSKESSSKESSFPTYTSLSNLYDKQRQYWSQNSVTAWTFIFTHS